jgi:hypothetical protein
VVRCAKTTLKYSRHLPLSLHIIGLRGPRFALTKITGDADNMKRLAFHLALRRSLFAVVRFARSCDPYRVPGSMSYHMGGKTRRYIVIFAFLTNILLVLSCSLHAQSTPWSNIISSSRAIDWSQAGLPAILPDGETTPHPWTPPTRTQCGPTLTPSGGDDTTQIVNAFNGSGSFSSCTPPYMVLLGSGIFHVNSFLRLGGNTTRNNITLRGSGPMSTTITIASGQGMQIGSCCSGGGAAALTSASSNYTVRQTTLLLQNATASPFVGAVAHLVQCDNGFTNSSPGNPLGTCTGSASDTGSIFHCSDPICASNGNQDSTRQQDKQTVRVTSATNIGGSNWTVTISPGLYLSDWTFSQGATLAWDNSSTFTSIGVGIEDMTIRPPDSGNPLAIGNGGYADWMKGVREMAFNNSRFFSIEDCSHCLAANNYWFANDPSNMTAGFSVTAGQQTSSDSLYINNIASQGSFMDDGGSQQGEVVAYNYSRDNCCNTDGYQSTLFTHAPGTQLMLRESNEWGRTNDDDTNGTHNMETDFRNNMNCGDPPYNLSPGIGGGIQYGSFARFENSVGNAIGFNTSPSTLCSSYQGTATDGFIWNINGGPTSDTNGLTLASSLRWGNVSAVTQSTDTPANSGIRFVSSEVPTSTVMPSSTHPNAAAYQNSVPANNNLPCSFFLQGYATSTSCTPHYNGGTGLSWWKVCTSWTTFPTSCALYNTPPFPANGPDVIASNGALNNYANDIPAAIAWKNLPIDTTFQASYTVSSSSWSGGTETLHVATMPITYPISGFQLTGAPAACSPTSGVSFTGRPDGEILITQSTTTTIQYSLAINPGTSCTGTVKWPDVRQFDERVYAVDSQTGTVPAAPTNLAVIVN